MTTASETEISQLKEFIGREFEKVNNKIGGLSDDLNSLKVDLATIKGELTGVNKRLDNLDFTNRTIFVAIVGALFAGLIKLFFPNFPHNV